MGYRQVENLFEFSHIFIASVFSDRYSWIENIIISKAWRAMENIMQNSETFECSNQKQAMPQNILLVENEKFMQEAVCKFFKPMGFEVTIACSGAEALSLFVDSPFSIVVTDFAIMHMNSLCLATHIKKISPATPVILLVGGESVEDINQLETGKGMFYSIIFKPFKMNELKSAIEGALIYGYR